MVTGCVVLLCRRASAAVRHRVWVLAIVGVLVIPGLLLAVPQLTLEFPAEAEVGGFVEGPSFTSQWLSTETITRSAVTKTKVQSTNAIQPEAASSAAPTRVASVSPTAKWSGASLLWIGWGRGRRSLDYLFGSVCVLHVSGAAVGGLRRRTMGTTVIAASRVTGRQCGVNWCVCDRQISPMTWGFRRPVILLPQGQLP